VRALRDDVRLALRGEASGADRRRFACKLMTEHQQCQVHFALQEHEVDDARDTWHSNGREVTQQGCMSVV
jgi:hypothetical protein